MATGGLRELTRLLPYVRRYRGRMLAGVLVVTLSNLCSTTIPRVVGATIDAIKAAPDDTDHILWLIAQILLLTAGSGVFMFLARRTLIVMSRFIEADLRNDYVAAVRIQSQSFFQQRTTGSLIALFTNDIGSVREFIGPAVMYTLNTLTTFVFALSFMSSLNPWLTLAIVLPVPGISYVTYRMGKKIHDNYKAVQEQYEHVTTHAQETFSGVRVVRAYAREASESERFRELSHDYYTKNMRLARVQALIMPAMGVLFNASYLIVIAIGGYLITQNTLTVGELTQFFIYLNQLMWPILAIGWVTNMVQRGAASVARIGVVLDTVPPIKDAPSTVQATDLPASVELRNVTLQYGDRVVLREVTLSIPAGTSLGIVGPVGSGKSSVASLIPRLQDASHGAVLVGGHDVTTLPLQTLRGMVGVVPQESFLFSDTIRENIRFGNRALTQEQVETAARIAQFDNEITALPHGYDTMVGERGVTLSGGQKQRCALARAIASDPKILILDDALSAIDSDTESRIMKGLTGVMRDRTTIIIAHRISTVRRCDQIIVLQDGVITERGTHEQLLALDGAYADMFERQQLEEELA